MGALAGFMGCKASTSQLGLLRRQNRAAPPCRASGLLPYRNPASARARAQVRAKERRVQQVEALQRRSVEKCGHLEDDIPTLTLP